MVSKLFKHEINAIFRKMLPIECIVVGIAIITRLIGLFNVDTVIYDIVSGSSYVALTVALIGGIAAAYVYGITRFYRNMFTHEGYLTLTLPVTPTQHIFVKSVVAVMFEVIAIIVSILSFCIAMSGEFVKELFLAVKYILKDALQYITPLNFWLYVIEFVVFLVIGLFSSFLLIYACISIGQTGKKNRVARAFGVYFIYYLIAQAFETVLLVVFVFLENVLPMNRIYMFISEHIQGVIHGGLVFMIVWSGLLSLVYFLVSRFIITKKLNLE